MLFVISAPSGAGKTTIIRELLKVMPGLGFSVSAATRKKRVNEIDGKDYHFITPEEFNERIKNNEFAEYEEVHGNYYGTLKSEIEPYLNSGNHLIFDVDVKGAVSVKTLYPESVLIWIDVPVTELLNRLKNRNTESKEEIEKRSSRIRMEDAMKDRFDFRVDNSKGLDAAVEETKRIIEKYNK